jgi:hypothetical protein
LPRRAGIGVKTSARPRREVLAPPNEVFHFRR